MKQVAVVGLGQFGTHLAKQLAVQGCDVLVLDAAESRVSAVRDDVHRALIADAKSFEALESVVAPTVDEVAVCLGDHIEASILCTLHLSQIGVKKILATAINEDHANILGRVGAHSVIFPDLETAERTARRMAHPNLLDYFPFAEEYRIMEYVMPRLLVGKTLRQSGLRADYRLLALAIRVGTAGEYHFMPDAEEVLHEGDILVVLGREIDLARFSVLE
ncbi:MAG: TrkA family potassium uptake protein [Planctomycetota bacterium]